MQSLDHGIAMKCCFVFRIPTSDAQDEFQISRWLCHKSQQIAEVFADSSHFAAGSLTCAQPTAPKTIMR